MWAVLAVSSVAACRGNALDTGSRDADASIGDAAAGGVDASSGDVGSTPDTQPTSSQACRAATLSAPASSIPPRAAVADACAIGASAETVWTNPGISYATADDGWRVVGRWASCGPTVVGFPAHDAIEFGANGRWRLLTIDAGTGALVPLTGSSAVSGYYDLPSLGPTTIRGEVPGQTLWSGRVSFAAAGDALRFVDQRSTTQVYARTTPSPDDGADNRSATTDGHCSMVGTWAVPANSNPISPQAAVFWFDGAGTFVGEPEGADGCTQTMYGTYALSSSGFQIVASRGLALGYCDGHYSISYTATFDASCNQVTLAPTFDECIGGKRGYFSQRTTLTRRGPEPDGGASMPPDARRVGLPIFAAACWQSQLPPPPTPATPTTTVADICGAAASATDWSVLVGPPEAVDDYRSHIVGRWSACGTKLAELPAHAGIEFGANGRWRLLAIDAGKGTLVPLATTSGTSGYYYALSRDRSASATYGALILVGELPSGTTWKFFLRYSGGENAIRFDRQSPDDGAGPIYARAAAAADNGASNPPPTADGACSMAGTWDGLPRDNPLGESPVVIAFDQAGNFVAGPAGYDLCRYSAIHGTYALGSARFQLTTAVQSGGCGWWNRAVYTAQFDATCNRLSVSRVSDPCDGFRHYFDEPTTLVRRVPPATSP